MRLGLITDIHNDIRRLENVVSALTEKGFDQLVTIGDTCDAFAPPEGSDEVAQLLLDHNAQGVWGNHDFVFRNNPSEFVKESFGQPTFDLMDLMEAELEIEGCFFSHVESSMDPRDPVQIWKLADETFSPFAYAIDAFQSKPNQFQFVGHYHCWFAATPEGQVSWDGESILDMSDGQRYFVIIAAVVSGSGAIFDTETKRLTPLTL